MDIHQVIREVGALCERHGLEANVRQEKGTILRINPFTQTAEELPATGRTTVITITYEENGGARDEEEVVVRKHGGDDYISLPVKRFPIFTGG